VSDSELAAGVAGLVVAGAVLAAPALDGLGLTDGVLDGGGLVAGGVDGPRVVPGGVDRLGRGVGLGVDWAGRCVGLAHGSELWPVTSTEARLAPVWPAVRARVDGLAPGLAWDTLAGLGLAAGDEPAGLGLTVEGGPDVLALASGDGLAELALLAGLAAGAATTGVDDGQLAAGCP
jgi:hypothetical protein